MRLLITGASGLLGLNLALEAAGEHTVFGVVNDHPLRTSAFTVITSDLLAPGTLDQLFEQVQPEWVIHCAALANIDACEGNPSLARRLNEELPGLLAARAARGGARLIHVSTDAVFDGQRGDYTEADTPNPLSVYAHTKLAGERAVTAAYPQAIIARVNLFGWSLSGRRSLAEFFFNHLKRGQPVRGFTDVYFCPLLANHLARIFLRMLAEDLHGLYHVVSPSCLSKYSFGQALARTFGLDETLITPISVTDSGLLAVRSPRLTLRTDRLAEALGELPLTWEEGLADFHRQHQSGYRQRVLAMKSP